MSLCFWWNYLTLYQSSRVLFSKTLTSTSSESFFNLLLSFIRNYKSIIHILNRTVPLFFCTLYELTELLTNKTAKLSDHIGGKIH